MDRRELDKVMDLVGAYGAVLEANPGGLAAPVSKLPAPKAEIKEALITLHQLLGSNSRKQQVMAGCDPATAAFVLSGEFRRNLENGLVMLARFVPDEDAAVCQLFSALAESAASTADPDRLLQMSVVQMERAGQIQTGISEEGRAILEELRRRSPVGAQRG